MRRTYGVSMRFKAGFTLPELIVVLVLLGILSAYVVMRFNGLDSGARAVAVKALAGRMRVAVDAVYNLSAVGGIENDSAGTVNLRGNTVRVAYGYPIAASEGVGAAMAGDLDGIGTDGIRLETVIGTSDTVLFVREDVREPEHCAVRYSYIIDRHPQPSIEVDVSNCQ